MATTEDNKPIVDTATGQQEKNSTQENSHSEDLIMPRLVWDREGQTIILSSNLFSKKSLEILKKRSEEEKAKEE